MHGYHLNFTLVWRNFGRLASGLVLSLELALVAIAIGALIGLGLALLHGSSKKPVRMLITAYVELIRNIPLLLLVYFVFYGLPTIVNIRYSATTSFIVTLSLYASAYLVEIFRSGLSAVPRGLIEAGKAIGLTPFQRLYLIRLPTMFRIVLPSLGNTMVSLFKDTSVATVIAVPELTFGAQWINLTSFRVIEVYLVVSVMYLITGYVIVRLLRQLEARFAINGVKR